MSGIYQTTRQWMRANGQQLTFTTASTTNSSAFPTGTSGLRIAATQACWVELMASATPVTSAYLPANTVEYIPAPDSAIISVIGYSTAGTMFITPVCG